MPWNEVSEVAQRLRLVLAILRRREPVAKVCRRFGVSRQTAYKYVARYHALGRQGLVERSRRNLGAGWPKRWTQRLVRLRKIRPTWGGRKLRWWLHRLQARRKLPSARTIQRWLATAGLARRKIHKRHHAGLRWGQARVAGYANHIWTVDYKGWFRTRRRQKIEPLTARDLYSRYLLAVTPVRSTAAREARRVFRRLFARFGLPKIIRCDRGSPFCGAGPHGLTQLSLWWHRLGIQVEFVRRRRGVHNNAHEQMHAVLQAEVADCPAASRAGQLRQLRRWQRHYNHARPHEALGMRTPASRYHPKKLRQARLRLPRYPSAWLVYRVQRSGNVRIAGKTYGIGRAFHGLPVGFQPVKNHPHNVYFGSLLLGQLHLDHDHSIRLTTA